jgi:hypothetical protein
VEAGSSVIEVKKSLDNPAAVEEFREQLAGYVRTRSQQTGNRYVGILTDGATWQVYLDNDGNFQKVAELALTPRDTDAFDRLMTWLEAVMATADRVRPVPSEIQAKLGQSSPSFALDIAELTALYEQCKDQPEVKLKRSLWAKLLTTALGTSFKDDTTLFVQHTYLVLVAETVAHAVVGFDLTDDALAPATIVTGAAFSESQITGVVEQDFFDWPLQASGGAAFVRRLARHIARFDWSEPEHDVLKYLYESVISPETRHDLGEYYTPDWLADVVVRETITDPLRQRVLDPSCGSGTFVFHAARAYLAAAEEAEMPLHEMLNGLTRNVTGMDLHPVAVTLARVTYLLAIGSRRLQDPGREAIAIPVYLGDSLQWQHDRQTLNRGELVVPTGEEGNLFSRELRFPERVTIDATRFDQLVERLADMATNRAPGSKPPSLKPVYAHFAIHPDDQGELRETFTTMCQLVDEGRNHVWGYYVRNVARPMWLTRAENHVDILIGNPPWLSYRYMPKAMQKQFEMESKARGLWKGAQVATHQDLSAYFVARTVELYLKPGGTFAFVMPFAVLSRIAYDGFRSGQLVPAAREENSGKSRMESGSLAVSFAQPWDLKAVKPGIFPVPASVVTGQHTPGRAVPLPQDTLSWSGRLPTANIEWDTAKGFLVSQPGRVEIANLDSTENPYRERFVNGANLYPRMLIFVDEKSASPLGSGSGRRAVVSARSTQEKAPWKSLPSHEGSVERQFVFPVHLGSTVAPFRLLTPEMAVLPFDGNVVMSDEGDPSPIDHYPGLAAWWSSARETWQTHRSSASKVTLLGQINWQGKLEKQQPAAPYRVVYSASGSILTAAVVTEERVVIEHKLYWANCTSLSEARYLTGIFNSVVLLERIQGFMSHGAFGPRDFDSYVFQADFPLFDVDTTTHSDLVQLVERAERIAADVALDETKSFQANRKKIRAALVNDGVSADIDEVVLSILGVRG